MPQAIQGANHSYILPDLQKFVQTPNDPQVGQKLALDTIQSFDGAGQAALITAISNPAQAESAKQLRNTLTQHLLPGADPQAVAVGLIFAKAAQSQPTV